MHPARARGVGEQAQTPTQWHPTSQPPQPRGSQGFSYPWIKALYHQGTGILLWRSKPAFPVTPEQGEHKHRALGSEWPRSLLFLQIQVRSTSPTSQSHPTAKNQLFQLSDIFSFSRVTVARPRCWAKHVTLLGCHPLTHPPNHNRKFKGTG